MNVFITLLLFIFLSSLVVAIQYDAIRAIAFVLMGIAMSSTSYIVYYKRLEFLAAESVHISLFSITLAYIIVYSLIGVQDYVLYTYNVLLVAFINGLFLVYLVALMIKRGLSQEKASAIVVSLTTAFSVIAIQYALTNMPMQYSLSSIILGEPLLMRREEALIGVIISLIIVITTSLLRREIVNTSIDPVSASLAGVKISLYDFIIYTLIGVTSIGLLRFAGYVMEHVLMLLPATITVFYSRNMREHYIGTLVLGASASAAGFALSIYLDTPPAGLTGVLMIIPLVIGLIREGRYD